MLVLALLAAMMLVALPALAAKQAGSKYNRNYYPEGYYDYCHPDGENYWGDEEAAEHCDKYYTEREKKQHKGKWYYYVHVFFVWDGEAEDDWYYARYKKYHVLKSLIPCYRAWVGHKPTGEYYWETFYPPDNGRLPPQGCNRF